MEITDNIFFDIALIILASIIVGVIATYFSIWLAKKLNIIDYPGRLAHHIHKVPTPRAGGIAIVISFVILIILFSLWQDEKLIQILLPSIVIFGFGVWDDRFGMNAPVKLLGQILAVTILILLGIRVQFLENQEFFIQFNQLAAYWLDIGITIFWMVGLINAFNMVDSMDGLALGLARISSGFFMFMTIISTQPSLVYLSAILFGVGWGIYLFNLQSARTFLGDSGAQVLGFLLAALAIAYRPQSSSQQSTWFVPVLLFIVPIFDTTLVTFSRIRKGKPFYKANRDHTYHRLMTFGWNSSHAVAVMHLTSILSCLSAVIALYSQPLQANLIFMVWMIFFFALMYFFEKKFFHTISEQQS